MSWLAEELKKRIERSIFSSEVASGLWIGAENASARIHLGVSNRSAQNDA
jgi:hypothetical protein